MNKKDEKNDFKDDELIVTDKGGGELDIEMSERVHKILSKQAKDRGMELEEYLVFTIEEYVKNFKENK